MSEMGLCSQSPWYSPFALALDFSSPDHPISGLLLALLEKRPSLLPGHTVDFPRWTSARRFFAESIQPETENAAFRSFGTFDRSG